MGSKRYRNTDTPSLLQGDVPEEDAYCYKCGRHLPCDFHHLLNGQPKRKEFAEESGAWVWLCRKDHRWVHDTAQGRKEWMRWNGLAQERYEEIHPHEDWMKGARKNYRG